MSSARTSTQRIESLVRQNTKLAKLLWSGELKSSSLSALRNLTHESGFALAAGEILWLEGGWYVTSAGLLRLAKENRCHGIHAHAVSKLSDAVNNRWVFKATVYKSSRSKGFVGYGDADPSNVSPLVRGAEMRVAETRAVNRALRKAYGIGLCSVEELGWLAGSSGPTKEQAAPSKPAHTNRSNNGQPRLRDRLCILIRQHNLDPAQVKAYAADFCGTPTLREANRELVESFISHLAKSVKENLGALICKLNSYAQAVEVKS